MRSQRRAASFAAAATLILLPAAGLQAGETCLLVSDHAGKPGEKVKTASLGPIEVTAAVDASGNVVPLVFADCTNDGGQELAIQWSGEQASSPARIALATACGGAAPVGVQATLLTGDAVLRARDAAGKLVDSAAAGPNFGFQKLFLEHSGGIATVDIAATQTCLVEVCWTCAEQPQPPASRLGFAPAVIAACGGQGTVAVTLEAAEPVAGIEVGLRWDRTALEVLAVRPGAGIPAEAIQSFHAEVEGAGSGLEPGEATARLSLVPGAAVGPGGGIAVLAIDVRAAGASGPNTQPSICLADGLGEPPLATRIHVVRANQTTGVQPPAVCEAVMLAPDRTPPSLACPEAKVIAGGPEGAVVSWQVAAEDDCPVEVTCDPPSGSLFPPGRTTVSCLAVDRAGNEARCSFTVDVVPAEEPFQRGDANGDGARDISDAVGILGFLFLGAVPPGCLRAADANDDGKVDISDAVGLLAFLFLGAAKPPPPFGACGSDPTPDGLSCELYPPCGRTPVPSFFTEALVERVISGAFPELAVVPDLREHLAYRFESPGAIDEGTVTTWSGGIAVAGPKRLLQLGQPTQLRSFDEQGQEVRHTWYHLGGGRLARPLVDAQNRALGVHTVGGAGSLFALDVDADGIADLIDVVDPGLGEVLFLERRAGAAYLERIVRRLSGRSSGTAISSLIRAPSGAAGAAFDPISGLRKVLGSRADGDWPQDLAAQPLLVSLLWLVERQALAGDAPADPSLAVPLPDLARVLPGPVIASGVQLDLVDHPVIEIFRADDPSCTIDSYEDYTTLRFRVSPGLGASPIVSVRLYALRRVKDVEWTPRHVVRSRYHIELVYEAPGSPDGATVIGSAEDAAGDNRYATTQYALTADDAAGRRTTRILPYAYVLSIEPPAQSYVRERPVWPVRSEDEGCYWWQYSIRIDPFRLESLAYQIRFAGETEFGPYQDVPYMLPVEGHALYDLVFLSRLPCEDRWSFWEGHGNVRGIRIRAKSQDDCSTYVEQEIEVRLIDRTPEPEPEPDPEPPPSTPSGPRPDLVARLRAADVASTSVRARVVNEGSATVGSPFKVRVTGSIPFNHTIDVGVPIAPGMAWVDSEYRPVAASAEVFPRGFTVDADFLDQIDEGRNELNNGQTCTLFFTFGDWACMPALE